VEFLASLLHINTLYGIAIGLASGILHGYTGFGGAVLMVPLLALFLDPVVAVQVTVIIALMGQAQLIPSAARQAEWRECRPFLIAALIASPIGAYVMLTVDTDIVRRLVGISTIGSAVVMLSGWTYDGRRTAIASGLFGALGGFINGSTAQGGPVAVAYFISAPLPAEQQRANIVLAIAGMIIITITVYILAGVFSLYVLALAILFGTPYALGVRGGNRLFDLVPKSFYRRASLSLLFVAGLLALIK